MKKLILLSFDVEEFDVPVEFGQTIAESQQFRVSAQGLESVLALLQRLQVRATFFVTANFALHHPAMIVAIAQHHEVASHGFYHSSFETADLARSKQVLAAISGQVVTGFRMARLQPVVDRDIQTAGYHYNSSLNPTYLPGRYNHFFHHRTAYYVDALCNIPVSVMPLVRLPLFWLSFKNLPLWFYKWASRLTLNHDAYLNLYFHPWEFTDIRGYQLPGYIKKHSGQAMLDRLENYLQWIRPYGKFATMADFYAQTQNSGWQR